MPYITLDWACRSCHPADADARADQLFTSRTADELEELARGYHDRD